MKNKNTAKIEFLKIVYFAEAAAQDYVDVTNGGRLDWSTQENKEKIAKIVAEDVYKRQIIFIDVCQELF